MSTETGGIAITAAAPQSSACRASCSASRLLSAPTLITTGPRPLAPPHTASATRRRSSSDSRSTSDTIAITRPSAPASKT